MAADTLLPYLPDLIVEKIFRLIPTKLAIRSSIVSKQWASVWSLGVPFLYFDDEGESDDRRTLLFMDFVESCLKHFERTKLLELDRFMLRMRYDCELIDSTRIDNWFSFVVDRCVKELYISIQRKDGNDDSVEAASTYYCIPHTILNAQYLTHLNLQHVKISDRSNDLINLSLLKTMTLYAVLFDCLDISLWEGCPSIEHLSLVSCSFSSLGPWGWQIVVNNSSLKFLQIIYCKCKHISIEAENLEFFVFISVFPQLGSIWLSDECVKLKNISVYAHHSDKTSFRMPEKCPHTLKAVIDIPQNAAIGTSKFAH
ncbi:PREDICTED: putative F-box protein At1g49610 [Fragaria vesca subsp. vesca]|uniref:putative F-box protein At1g49610 n=1 Tax=Fragaria vesca subsp. vesca TaxID=101020 RepID=UPI0002C30581|nr:PREDICTED: putative F-box protein At1g49610 [Fragaria vesca subsp. vesca]